MAVDVKVKTKLTQGCFSISASEKLCELLKCGTPVGSWCQVVQENGILIPKCVCPQSCPR